MRIIHELIFVTYVSIGMFYCTSRFESISDNDGVNFAYNILLTLFWPLFMVADYSRK